MALLNYTTGVDALKTVSDISRMLALHGARAVTTGYGTDGQPDSIAFVIATRFGNRPFRLPARIEAVERTLLAQWKKRKVERRHTTPEHARRVAWRIVKDWVEAQLAIVESGMVTMEEVMFPYLLDSTNRTAFEFAVERHLALEGPKPDASPDP